MPAIDVLVLLIRWESNFALIGPLKSQPHWSMKTEQCKLIGQQKETPRDYSVSVVYLMYVCMYV